MLLGGLSFDLVYLIIALLVALTIHEASHALVANWLGDPTPKNMGRLSLNPFAHLEPLGALMILTIGLGWGKPVQINAANLKPGPKIGMALVAIAGPISNLLLAAVLGLLLRFHLVSLIPQEILRLDFMPAGYHAIYFSLGLLIGYTVLLSLSLAVFNLIPLSPLDGSRLWQIILPTRWYYLLARVELLSLGVVMALILSDRFFNTTILARLLSPPVEFLWFKLIGMGPLR